MRIKVCGMTDITQMHQLGDMGVEFAGMIFYHKSPRFVLKHGLTGVEVKKEKLKVYKVGVFVNSTYDEVMNHVENFGLDMVQLHGNETPYQCDKIANYIQVIKAFRFAQYDHVEWMIRDFYNCSDMFLFDSGVTVPKTENEYGGTGKKFNWKRLSSVEMNKSFFLSGGIGPDDVAVLKDFMKQKVAKDLFAIDINSRFEVLPGVKDLDMIRKFIKELKDEVSDTTKAE
jgi:phosphoribosylanthranilate isomerase